MGKTMVIFFGYGPRYVSDVLNCKSGVFGRKGGFVCMYVCMYVCM